MADPLPAPVPVPAPDIAPVIPSGIPQPSPEAIVIPRSEIPGKSNTWVIVGGVIILALIAFVYYKRTQAGKPAPVSTK